MIGNEVMKDIIKNISEMIDHGEASINNNVVTVPIYKMVIDESKIKVYLYFDDKIEGKFENFKLISKNGNVFAIKPEAIIKSGNAGLLMHFEIDVREE